MLHHFPMITPKIQSIDNHIFIYHRIRLLEFTKPCLVLQPRKIHIYKKPQTKLYICKRTIFIYHRKCIDMKLEDKISGIPDFPKPGILFRHFGPILADPNAMTFMVEEFAKKINPSEVDVFVGIESRGFIIATALATLQKTI